MAEDETGSDEQPTPSVDEVDPALLEILVCPQSHGRLVYEKHQKELISAAAGLAYPIRDGVPIMLADEARELSDDERARYKP